MPTMINRGKELLRICPTNTAKLEYSTNGGRYWIIRFNGNSSIGQFSDLMDNGKEDHGTTSKGFCVNDRNNKCYFHTTEEIIVDVDHMYNIYNDLLL